MTGEWPRVEMLEYRVRKEVSRRVVDLAALRADTMTPGELPERGTAAVVGTVDPFEDHLVRPAGSLTPSVVCRVRVDAYSGPVRNPGERSFTDGLVATDDVHAVPFVLVESAGRDLGDDANGVKDVSDGGHSGPARAVVDPVPRAADEGLVPETSVRPRAAYVTSDLQFPREELVVADHLRELDERRRAWLCETTSLADGAFVRVLERRVEPGDRVRVLGHRVRPGPSVERDLISVASWRSPFRVEPAPTG